MTVCEEMAIRIVLVDDHPLVVKGLEQLLQSSPDFEVLTTCSTAAEGLQAVETLKPDVLVLDLKLAGRGRPEPASAARFDQAAGGRGAHRQPGRRRSAGRGAAGRARHRAEGDGASRARGLPADGVCRRPEPQRRRRRPRKPADAASERRGRARTGAHASRARDPAPGCGASRQSGNRHASLDQRRHGEDPSSPRLREAAASRPPRSAGLLAGSVCTDAAGSTLETGVTVQARSSSGDPIDQSAPLAGRRQIRL